MGRRLYIFATGDDALKLLQGIEERIQLQYALCFVER
jgi:hypothetical protein